jgi:hypothetical protein
VPGSFERKQHYYERVLNAQLHPLVGFFLRLGNERTAQRYCRLHPEADPHVVRELLGSCPRFFRWAGGDLLRATNQHGAPRMVLLETNSCPSGQKSTPAFDLSSEQDGYRQLLERCFLPLAGQRGLPPGDLAVLFDKNPMEATGYAATLADLTGNRVLLARMPTGVPEPNVRVDDKGVLQVRSAADGWLPVRAALRYVTQRPWDRLPPITRTAVLNPVIACLAGGRNKLVAAKAYDWYSAELAPAGLSIRVPETIWDVTRDEVSLWVRRMGGAAVVKNPYSNAGQGVYTIVGEGELQQFLEQEHRYARFIVQALVGHKDWSSTGTKERLFQIGTIPNRRGKVFVSDLRFMVSAGPDGFRPAAIYARRARRSLTEPWTGAHRSWDVLGTNLSVRQPNGEWTTETERLLLMDGRDFNQLGLGIDDLIEGYLQTVLAVLAIDRMARRLVTKKGVFRRRLFRSICPDPVLQEEILR